MAKVELHMAVKIILWLDVAQESWALSDEKRYLRGRLKKKEKDWKEESLNSRRLKYQWRGEHQGLPTQKRDANTRFSTEVVREKGMREHVS
jgi:hypothetical protein